jgi:hypothetical protein
MCISEKNIFENVKTGKESASLIQFLPKTLFGLWALGTGWDQVKADGREKRKIGRKYKIAD